MQRLLARSADSLRECMGTLKWGGEEGGEGRRERVDNIE